MSREGEPIGNHRPIEPVILECTHLARFYPAPRLGDIVYCQTCRDFRQVRRRNRDTPYLKIKCASCQYARRFELDQSELARIKGDTHRLRTGHIVWLIDQSGKSLAI